MATEFSWSVSRHETFQTCARRYYYAYYAAPEDEEIRRLKRLSALPLWAGSVVHETIEAFFKERDALPSETEQQAIVKSAVHDRMLADWRESESGPLGFRLFEHEYGQPVEAEDKKLAVGTVMRSLRNFFNSPTLAAALRAGRSRFLSIEDLVGFEVGSTPVMLRMDFAFRETDGRVVIVDWKTGRAEGRFNEVQLAGYALFAARQGWVESPEQLVTELAYLQTSRDVRRSVDGKTLQRAQAFIEKSASRMKERLLDPLTNAARLEDFPMIDRPQVCRRCNFRRLCFPRQEASPAHTQEMPDVR